MDTTYTATYRVNGGPWADVPGSVTIPGVPVGQFGEVDLVYIDPPYNTGNDFAYADDIRAQDGLSRHEAWVAMMRPRLVASREVMSARSAIWVSIDDNEVAWLLMDEVFGEANFLAQVVVNLNPKGRNLQRVRDQPRARSPGTRAPRRCTRAAPRPWTSATSR